MGWQYSLGTFAFSRGTWFLDHPEISPPAPIRAGAGRVGPGPGPGRELGPALARPARPAPEVLVLVRPAVPFRPRGFVARLARAQAVAVPVQVQAGPGKLRCAPPPPRPRGPLLRAAPAKHTAPRAAHAAPRAGQTAPPGRTASLRGLAMPPYTCPVCGKDKGPKWQRRGPGSWIAPPRSPSARSNSRWTNGSRPRGTGPRALAPGPRAPQPAGPASGQEGGAPPRSAGTPPNAYVMGGVPTRCISPPPPPPPNPASLPFPPPSPLKYRCDEG